MALFADPETHAANPPETWQTVKRGDRVWEVQTKDGGNLDRHVRKIDADTSRTCPESRIRLMYAEEGRWFAGETKPGQRSWAECKAERERIAERQAAREAERAAELARLAEPLAPEATVGRTFERVETKQTLAEDPYDDKRILTAITLHFTDGTRLTYNEEDGETYHQGDVVETSECERPGCEVWIGRVVSEDNPEGEWVNHSGSTWCENGTGEHVPSEINRQAA